MSKRPPMFRELRFLAGLICPKCSRSNDIRPDASMAHCPCGHVYCETLLVNCTPIRRARKSRRPKRLLSCTQQN